jgi:hypothetical protein
MRAVDNYLIGKHDPETNVLDGSGYLSNLGFAIYDDQTQIDPMSPDKVTVTYPVPFATYSSSVGDDDNRRLSGRRARRSVFFSFVYVGETREQAKWAGERLRRALERHRPASLTDPETLETYRCWPISLLLGGSQRVRRDDAVMRPDGSPLFYGIDDFAVSLALHPTVGADA